MSRNHNPHHGLESQFITPWDHRSGHRYDTPSSIQNAQRTINWSAHTHKNTDRPLTSSVVSIMVNTADVPKPTPEVKANGYQDFSKVPYEHLKRSFKLLEDYAYEYQPINPARDYDGQKYKINKLINTRDIDQWRGHIATSYITELLPDGRASKYTFHRSEAVNFYVKQLDSNGKPSHYTADLGEAIDYQSEGKELKPRILRNETYYIMFHFKGYQGVDLFTGNSQVGPIRYTNMRCHSHGKTEFLSDNAGNEIMLQINKEYLFFSEDMVRENSGGEKFVKVKLGYGHAEERYLPLLTAAEAGF